MNTNDEISALRRFPCSANSAIVPTTKHASAVMYGARGSPSAGRCCLTDSPRAPTRGVMITSTTMITMNGSASPKPRCGSHVQSVISLPVTDCPMPSRSPAIAAMKNELKRASSATPSAGTMSSV